MRKKLQALLCLVLFVQFYLQINAASVPATAPANIATIIQPPKNLNLHLQDLTVKNFEKLLGHPLKFKEKVALKFLRLQLRISGKESFSIPSNDLKVENRAYLANFLGITSLIVLGLGIFVPAIILLAIPTSITAVILGATTIKKAKDPTKSRRGIIYGSISLAICLVFLTLIILFIASLGPK